LGYINKTTVKWGMAFPGFVAGFGSYDAWPDPNPPKGWQSVDGNRRWGYVPTTLIIHRDPCGDPFEQWCNDDYEWEDVRYWKPAVQTQKGDSGGPLLLTMVPGQLVPTEALMIVGVDSGLFKNGWPQDNTPTTVWASTGWPGGTNNGAWIVEHCLDDADGDKITDAEDNCPTKFCVDRGMHASQCYNPDQVDADEDGVGDACDNCKPELCEAIKAAKGSLPPNFDCWNPSQANFDLDSRGDACDVCPETNAGDPGAASLASQTDGDKDGIGDACDHCDKPNPYDTCGGDSDCWYTWCVIEPGADAGHCSVETDSDQDKIPDACDLCPGFENPDNDNLNSNRIAEEREKQFDSALPNLADVCDAVPIVRVPPTKVKHLTSAELANLSPGDGVDEDDIVLIPEHRWLGTDLDAPMATKTVQRKVAYRQCACLAGAGAIATLDKCVSMLGDAACPAANPSGDAVHWRKISGKDESGPIGADGLTAPQTFKTGSLYQPQQPLQWHWRDDVLAGKVTGFGTCPGTSPLDCKTHGALYAGTKKAAPFASAREANHVLGDVFQMIDTPGLAVTVNSKPPNSYESDWWKGYVHPDYSLDPDPFGFSAFFSHPTPFAVLPSGSVAAFLSPTEAIDISPFIDPRVRQALVVGTLWLTAVEPARIARMSNSTAVRSGVHAVALQSDFSGVPPMPVAVTAAGMKALTRAVDAIQSFSPSSASLQVPPPLHGVQGAFSAVEGSVYMVGGTLDDGQAAETVWRWSIDQDGWQAFGELGRYVPSTEVLSIAYDPSGQHLYVLDLNDDDILPNLRFVRLFRIDLAKGESTQLATFPRAGKPLLGAIAVMPDGNIALVAAGTKSYQVWRLDGKGDHAVFKGVLTGVGAVSDPPVMGEDRLYLPVLKQGKLNMVELGAELFHGGPPCTSL
jgi:hypothetical protein